MNKTDLIKSISDSTGLKNTEATRLVDAVFDTISANLRRGEQVAVSGFGTFVVIVLTVTILVFRVMRVTLTEWVGDSMPAVRNMHVSSLISMILTAALVLTGTWVYLWQMFGASNQLMAALSLLVVSVWLKSEKRNPTYALLPMIFMYVTTLAATVITARNLYVTIAANPKIEGLPVYGAWAMIAVSVLLFAAAILIGWDGYKAYRRYHAAPTPPPATVPAE